MTFSEKLQAYKTGLLPEPEQEAVRQDIEKHQAIEEYLYESDAEELLPDAGLEVGGTEQDEQTFSKMMKSAIRRAFIKAGVITVCVTLTLTLLFAVVLPGVVSLFYYNPTKKSSSGDSYSDMQGRIDVAVYTELFRPEDYCNEMVCLSEGYGTYSIKITHRSVGKRSGYYYDSVGKIERGQFDWSFDWQMFNRVTNLYIPVNMLTEEERERYAYSYTDEYLSKMLEEKQQELEEKLQALDDNTYYAVRLSLKEMTDYEACNQLAYDHGRLHAWDDDVWFYFDIGEPYNGLRKYPSFFIYRDEFFLYDYERYPALRPTASEGNGYSNAEEDVKQHVVSMLRYVADHPQMRKLYYLNTTLEWDQAADYVEANPLRAYAIGFVGKKEEILKWYQDDAVAYIDTSIIM